MKITRQPIYGQPGASMRQHRLQLILAAWRFPRLLYAADRGVPPPGSVLYADELTLWLEILRVAQPVPPRYHLDGLRTYARLHGLSIGDLERDKVILIVGDQVAAHGQLPRIGYLGLHWSLLVPAEISGHSTEAVLRKRFQNVEVHGDELVASTSWENCTDSIAPLVAATLSVSPEGLVRLWKVALALRLQYRFLPALPQGPAKTLAELLAKELEAAAPRLTVAADARLLHFARSGADEAAAPRELQLPESRLTELLEVERFFEHAHHVFSEWYYDDLARSLALVADVYALGEILRNLPPGSALEAALDAIWLDRPELIATYVFHPAYQPEGALLLLRLQQRGTVGYRNDPLEFNEEWLEAQELGRELLLLGEQGGQTTAWSSLVALGIHDESDGLRRRHWGTTGIDRGKAQYDGAALWAQAVANPARGLHFVDVLERHFTVRERLSDAAIVFALRLLRPLRESDQAALATRLATAIVDGYAATLALDAEGFVTFTVVPAYGELLASLHDSLDSASEAWRTFLRPFRAAGYLERALAEQGQSVSSTRSANFLVPQILRAHAGVLVALAGSIAEFEAPLRAAIELYDADRSAALYVTAFSWHGLARVTSFSTPVIGEPLFVAVGRLLARVQGSPRWLTDFLGKVSEPHVLAGIAAGLGASNPIAEEIRPQLRAQLNALLSDERGIALGHTLEMASLLQLAAMPRDSERFARRALAIIKERLPKGGGQFEQTARSLLAGALAQQGLWLELLAFEPERNAMVLSPQARFIENMRALALMETGKLAEAQDAIRRILSIDATDKVAQVNLTAVLVRRGAWREAVEVAEKARPLLSGDELDRLLRNESSALELMGDTFGAANVLEALTAAARARTDVAEARIRLRRGQRSSALPVPEVASGASEAAAALATGDAEPGTTAQDAPALLAPPTTPSDRVDVAIITVLEEEYNAVRTLISDGKLVSADGSQYPNIYGWFTGTIPRAEGNGVYRVVVALAGISGNIRTYSTTKQTIDRWQPRYVLLSGIAGGLPKEGLVQGDIVISQQVWYYEYGKAVAGEFRPRHRDVFRVDGGLLNSARAFKVTSSAWKACKVPPPQTGHVAKVVIGLFASGEKVIDDIDLPYVQDILRERPDSQAIEMEGVGACAAVEHAHDEGKAVGFLMVRGISDMPAGASGWAVNPIARLLRLDQLVPRRATASSGTGPRDSWKAYASAIAATFIISWIATAWPVIPRSSQP